MSGMSQIIPIVFGVVATVATGGLAAPAMMLGGGLFSSIAAGVGLTGTLGAIVSGAASTALMGAVVGGIGAAATGGDFLEGVKNGAISGAVSGGIGGALSGGGAATAASMGGDVASSLTAAEASTPFTLGSGTAAPAVASGVNSTVGVGSGGLGFDPSAMHEGPVSPDGWGAAAGAPAPIASAGSATSGAAGTVAAAAEGGMFDGLLNKETLGGALSGVGKVLSGDTARAAAKENNQGALNRQTQQQDYISGNYSGATGLLDAPAAGPAGLRTPQQAFANTQIDAAAREYYYDPQLRQIVYRARAS